MADTEIAPTEFQLTVPVNFEAKDIVEDIPILDVLELIQELDAEIDTWEVTVLLARRFTKLAEQAPPEVLAMTDDELETSLETAEPATED